MLEKSEQVEASELFTFYIEDAKTAGCDIELVQLDPGIMIVDYDHLSNLLGCERGQLAKTVCLNYKLNGQRTLISVVVRADDRVDTKKVGDFLGVSSVKAAQGEFITESTGFVPGGIPPVGFDSIKMVDSKIFEGETWFAGGGNNKNCFTKFVPETLKKLYPNVIVDDFTMKSGN